MKRTFTLIIGLIFTVATFAQTIEEARNLIYHERYISAANMLHRLLSIDPHNGEAWYQLTNAYLELGKVKEIKDSLQKAPQDVLDQPLVSSAIGHILLRENDNVNAQVKFETALKQTKEKDPSVLKEIARAYIDTKDADASIAIVYLNKAIKRDKKDPETYVLLGDAYSKLSNGSEAFTAYKKALEVDPSYARASYRLGKIFTSQKNTVYLDYFNDALKADSAYAPALYELYYHYYFRDVAAAMVELKKYIAASDYTTEDDYLITDMLYLNKDYKEAIKKGETLISKEGNDVSPRIYKLMANSYLMLNDTTNAVTFMRKYFDKNTDTTYLATDFETMGKIYESMQTTKDSAAHYYALASDFVKADSSKSRLYKKAAEMYGKAKDYFNQGNWLRKYYEGNPRATNVDLFNCGTAYYYGKAYHIADSVFKIYTEKYPEQEFGYYWRARCNVAIDTAMEQGLAIPYYVKVIEIAEKDTTNELNRKRLVESYGYIASYKANHDKDYSGAMEYFEKILLLQPENQDAKRYVGILKKFTSDNENSSN